MPYGNLSNTVTSLLQPYIFLQKKIVVNMATLLILPIFFLPIGDCINRVPLYYLFDEKKINSRELIQNQRTIKQKKKSEEKGKNIYVFILQSKMEDGGNIIM